ncbi:MAG: hypothetical protein ACLP1E_10640 [Acidimicrobiales bacterium]
MRDEVLPEGEEPRRLLGMPIPHGVVREGEEPKRVLGMPIPLTWIDLPRFHMRRFLHPVRWMRWRLQVRRLGPYAPDYDDSGRNTPDH